MEKGSNTRFSVDTQYMHYIYILIFLGLCIMYVILSITNNSRQRLVKIPEIKLCAVEWSLLNLKLPMYMLNEFGKQ